MLKKKVDADPRSFGLYVIIDGGRNDYLDLAVGALAGGADAIQLRDKTSTTSRLVKIAFELRQMTAAAGKPLIINDRLDIALVVKADGVHLGKNDLPTGLARQLSGNRSFIIGASAGSLEAARDCVKAGADYLGVGPIFPTFSKVDAGPVIGLTNLHSLCRNVDIPVIAIGGINSGRVEKTLEAGAAGIAVISAIDQEKNAKAAVEAIKEKVHRYHDTYRTASPR